MKIIRVFAQLIDLLAAFGIFLSSFLLLLPLLSRLTANTALCAVLVLAVGLLLVVGAQRLFMAGGQTIGKAFFGLRVESEDPARPLTASILLQREVFCKLMSCYFICLPMLFGQPGGHEVATQTRVVRVERQAKHTRRLKGA